MLHFLSIIILSFVSPAFSQAMATGDKIEGYVWDLKEEDRSEGENMALIPPPRPLAEVELKDKIFDERLTREFSEGYKTKFGYTNAEVTKNFVPQTLTTGDSARFSDEVQDTQNKQREFADYMFRRLAEYHVDKFFKTEPNLAAVYQLKEKLSNVDVRVSENVKMNANYSFGANVLSARMETPLVTAGARVEMNPSSFGPSDVQEIIGSLARAVTPTLIIESYYRFQSQVLSLVAKKHVATALETTLTASSEYKAPPAHPNDKDNRILAGLTYLY